MKKEYLKPEMEVLEIKTESLILAASDLDQDFGGSEGDGDGDDF